MRHYVKAALPEQFDAFVWFEDTEAITPLGLSVAGELRETYPTGL
jgi:hypothetical protein